MRDIPLIYFHFCLFSFFLHPLHLLPLTLFYAFIESPLDDQMLNSQCKIKAVGRCEAPTIGVGIICRRVARSKGRCLSLNRALYVVIRSRPSPPRLRRYCFTPKLFSVALRVFQKDTLFIINTFPSYIKVTKYFIINGISCKIMEKGS